MRTDVVTTSRDTPAETVLDRLVYHLPVVEDGRPVGTVTTTDPTGERTRRVSGL
jgi:CBS domain-containing protein